MERAHGFFHPSAHSVCRSEFPGQECYLHYRISGSMVVAFLIPVA